MSISSRPLRACWWFLPAFLLMSSSLSHCSWTPEVKTNIYEGPEGAVALETVSAETFENSYPITLSPTQLTQAFKGIHLVAHKGLFQTILTGEETPERLFSDQAVAFLAPLVLTALAKATPEEQVIFSLPVEGAGHISGHVAYLDHTLFITITKLPVSSHLLPKGGRPSPASNPSGIHPYTLVFLPREAEYTGSLPPWLREQTSYLHVGIHLPDLATTRNSNVQPSTSPAAAPAPGNQHSEPQTEESPDRRPSDMQHLLEEIRALREELENQQAEIERLKNGLE